jgi:hypothetical protein
MVTRFKVKTIAVTEDKKAEQNDLLTALGNIRKLAEKEGLTGNFFAEARWQLEAVAGLLNITPTQTALFALLLEYSGTERASLTGLAETLKCSRIEALRQVDNLAELERRHLITSFNADDIDFFEPSSFMKKRRGISNPSYIVPMDVFEAIKADRPYRYTVYCNLSPDEFFTAADSLLQQYRRKGLSAGRFRNEILSLFNSNRDSAFVKGIKELGLDFTSDMILLAFCTAMVEDDSYSLGIKAIRGFFPRHGSIDVRQFRLGNHPLFEQMLIEHVCDEGMADTEEFCLTGKARDLLLSDIDLKERRQNRGVDIINAGSIAEKTLFYSGRIKDRVAELASLLKEEKFSLVKARLRKQNMRTGFACLFSGPPGTGKTETAYQIARETGRDIMLVDIAATKSMWFGESEKKIKGLFDRYQSLVKYSSVTPILLFNEADAVLGRRMNLGDSSRGPGQTENAIQNIILQEMENLPGASLSPPPI